MNWEAIGAIGEILGAIAVLITLFYLAVQIKQNSAATKNAASESMLAAGQNTALTVASTEGGIDVWVRGREDYASLTNTEKNRLRLFYISQMMATDNLYWSYKKGNLEEELWERQSNWMRSYLETEAGKAVWAQQTSAGGFTRSFIEYCNAEYRDQLEGVDPLEDWRSI